MAARITVKYLGDAEKENLIGERLAEELKDYPDWRVSVLGSAGNDVWEIKVHGPRTDQFGVMKLEHDQTVENAVKQALTLVRIADRVEKETKAD